MAKRILLLNSTYECIAFITERKALKLLVKDKVDILSEWDHTISWSSGKMRIPAIIRMKYYVPRFFKRRRCNRVGILKRDQYVCQYCGAAEPPSKLTVDHIKPRCLGGVTTWENCVTACFDCNNKKSDKPLEKTGMKLLHKPKIPLVTVKYEYLVMQDKHQDWKNYII